MIQHATLPAVSDDQDRLTFSTYDPADATQGVAQYACATLRDHDDTLEAAHSAFGAWSGLAANPRCDLVAQWLNRVEDATEDLAQIMTAEQGKPLGEARAEVGKALREARQMVGFARAHAGHERPARAPNWRNLVLRRPRGIVAAIAPWNFPVLTPLRKLVPALAVGNTVILKPSEFAPGAAMVLVSLAEGLFPRGVLCLLNGAGDVAARLVSDPKIAAVTFTGSVATGRKVAVAAGQNLVPVSLELGGKNAAVVDQITDLDGALDAIVGAAFQCAGQRCTSISRVIAHKNVLDAVRDGLLSRLAALHAGRGQDAKTTLGPITTNAQIETIDRLVTAARAAGAVCHTGGEKLSVDAAPNGRFYAPTLLETDDPQNPGAQEEIFGPVLTLMAYDTDDEAMALLNGTKFGLTSAIFTDRLAFAHRALAETASGMIHVNSGTMPDDNMPFVGTKASGLGTGSVGASTLDFFTTEHAAYVTAI